MGWIHLFNKKDSMHFNGSPAHQRLSDAMKSTGQFLPNRPVSQSCHTTHPTPSAGGEGGKKRGYRRPYRGFWPVNMRKPSYSRAGRVWLTVVQYWLVKGLERRLTLGRLKACSKGLVLNVMFMQYSEKRNTGIQHTRAVLNTELHKHNTHTYTHTQTRTHVWRGSVQNPVSNWVMHPCPKTRRERDGTESQTGGRGKRLDLPGLSSRHPEEEIVQECWRLVAYSNPVLID